MYISRLQIKNFRNFKNSTIDFSPNLNVIIGHNNAGKTNLIQALHRVFANRGNRSRAVIDDFNKANTNFEEPPEIVITATITEYEDADDDSNVVYDWLVKHDSPYEAQLTYHLFLPVGSDYDNYKKEIVELKNDDGEYDSEKCWALIERYYLPKYVFRIYGGNPSLREKADSEMLEKFDFQFLDAIRDAERQMFYGHNTILKEVLNYFLDYDLLKGKSRTECDDDTIKKLKQREEDFVAKAKELLKGLSERVSKSDILEYSDETGAHKGGVPDFDANASEKDLLFALRLVVERSGFHVPITNNGLGYNNLLFIALILAKMQMECSDFVGDNAKVFPILAIEEPEAHLHPAMQYQFLRFLKKNLSDKKQVRQTFITTHSTHITAAVDLGSIVCLYEDEKEKFRVAYPGRAVAEKDSRAYVQRFLDATKSNMLFSSRIIFVEGIAEQLLLPCFAAYLGLEDSLLKQHVAIVGVDSRTFHHFLKLFQFKEPENESAIKRRIACITDADPVMKTGTPSRWKKCYPVELGAGDDFKALSSHVINLIDIADEHDNVKIFHPPASTGKTLEYELAMANPNSDLLFTSSMATDGKNGTTSLKAMQALMEAGTVQFSSVKEKCLNENIAAKYDTCAWDDKKKSEALFSSVYYEAVSDAKGEHAFELEYSLRENLDSSTRKPFNVPDYIKSAFEYILKD
ncbi:MAG: AAA family ATPase [Deltaproteobacteria bacterium]|nr:AAA family ATPase [Deltaproteobacteria bacterium]